MAIGQAIVKLEQLKRKLSASGEAVTTVWHPYEALGDVLEVLVILKREERENDAPRTRQNAPQGQGTSEPAERATVETAGEVSSRKDSEAPGLEESKWSKVEGRKARARPRAPLVDLTKEDKPTYSQIAARSTPAPAQEQNGTVKKVAKQQQQAPKRETPAFKLILARESDWRPRQQLSGIQLQQEIGAKMGEEVARAILGMRIHPGGTVVISPKPGRGEMIQNQDWRKWARSARPYVDGTEIIVKYLPVDNDISVEEIVDKLID